MIPSWTEKAFHKLADSLFAALPRPLPNKDRLKECKLISHRGEHDNKQVFENTLPAFDRIKDHGVWGMELDIRWTKDLHPVVCHDADFHRLFGSALEVSQMTWTDVKSKFPMVPSLEEVIVRYGRILHLMVEIKKEDYPDPVYQNQVLKDLFQHLEPRKDFHFLSLAPEMFEFIEFVPTQAFLPIAQINVHELSEMAAKKGYGGIVGHYLFLTNRVKKRHHDLGQKIGTGYSNSKNGLFREINRGVDWIFSNNALEMETILSTNG